MSQLQISSEQFFNFFNQDKPEELDKLVNKIRELSHKIQNTEEQSFYFRRALESHQEDLKNLKDQYKKLRHHVNNTSFEAVKRQIQTKEKKIQKFEQRTPNFVNRVGLASFRSDLNYLELILNLKEKYGSIPSLG